MEHREPENKIKAMKKGEKYSSATSKECLLSAINFIVW